MLSDAKEPLTRSVGPAPLTERHAEKPAPFIALVGSDGAGKSTLSTELVTILARQQKWPVVYAYLGLGTGDLGRRIKAWPVVGPLLEKFFTSKARKTRTKGEKIPGPVTALVVFFFSLRRAARFRKALDDRKHGKIVIADRYPQAEIPGWCDGPGLSAANTSNRFIKWLARLERRLYRDMASVHPDLIILLDVDVDTAIARKPDHDPEMLQTKIEVLHKLSFDGAPLVTLDARQNYTNVRQAVLDLTEHIIVDAAIGG